MRNGTKTINQAVKRHINKFPQRYYFQLTKEEYMYLKSQSGTSSLSKYGGVRKMPFAFTEQGVAMLATVLHTNIADEISMRIIDAFIYMRKYISSNLFEQKYINSLVFEDHEKIKLLESSFNKFSAKEKTIIYEGKIYDANSVLMDIFNEVKEEIIIIDNYANKEILDMLKNINKRIIIMSKIWIKY